MIVIEVTNQSTGESKQFSVESSIDEITLIRFVNFKETVDVNKPQSLLDYEEADEEERKELLFSTGMEEIIKWNDYFVSFVQYWLKMPDEWVSNLSEEQINFLYKLVNDCFLAFDYVQKTSFTFKGENYYYPNESLNPFVNQKEYFKGNRVIDAVESLQFEMFAEQLGKSKWKVLPNIIAVLCKHKDEELPLKSLAREKWIAERSKLFEELPVSEALNVAFFLLRRKNTSLEDLNRCLVDMVEKVQARLQEQSGRDMDGIPVLSS